MNKVYLVRPVVVLVVVMTTLKLHAQPSTEVNLIRNGDFERKNVGFSSDYRYDDSGSPGSYVITKDATYNNNDFANPIYGDHTMSEGYYLIANANGQSGQKIWCGNAKVIPNARYEFTAYFCNVYVKLPPKTNFAFEKGDAKGNDPELKVTIGNEEIALEKDIYHLFRWIPITGTWYSGKNSTYVQICIENTNLSITGNDVAIDDISFIYIETMPKDYQPPKRAITVVDRHYVVPKDTVKVKMPLSAHGEFDFRDTVADGVYVLHPKPWHPIVVEPEPEVKKDSIIERI
ncbi:MAG TPA: hypothetical protein VK750_05685, partial [Cytophagaceae bacterium]|nr:hypothetical protein [Cytophagaceae bacterium]